MNEHACCKQNMGRSGEGVFVAIIRVIRQCFFPNCRETVKRLDITAVLICWYTTLSKLGLKFSVAPSKENIINILTLLGNEHVTSFQFTPCAHQLLKF